MPIMVVAFRDGLVLTVLRQAVFYMAPIVVWMAIARFLNVPMARDLRAAMARLRRRDAIHGIAESGAKPELAHSAPVAGASGDLPPAVRRRRLALANRGS
jgi:hypothetical protein